MVARGDLGVEVPSEKVPLIQKKIIEKAREAGKPVVIATQLLDSMIERPVPTRAEISDIANSIFDGADALMVTGETAIGKHPKRVIKVLLRVIKETESSINYKNYFIRALSILFIYSSFLSIFLLMSRAAVLALILVFTSILILVVISKRRIYYLKNGLIILTMITSIFSYNVLNEKNAYNTLTDRFSNVTNPAADESVNERLKLNLGFI